jgi:hypothetical protein
MGDALVWVVDVRHLGSNRIKLTASGYNNDGRLLHGFEHSVSLAGSILLPPRNLYLRQQNTDGVE